MTPEEISILKQANRIKEENAIQKIHLDNWLSRAVTATNKKGDKYLYSSFDEFYTFKSNEDTNDPKPVVKSSSKNREVDKSKRTTEDLMKIALNLREYNKNK